jgi:3-deoxy-D-manno-octulosonate 8-phosphate phosphatase (KDO 8-P phosphatase)
MQNIEKFFKGKFLVNAEEIQQKLKKIKAFVFDWDGVFNNGHKTETGSSSFSEIDSMGTNLLRFNYYLINEQLPFTAIISGEQNKAAVSFAEREHFYAIYSGIKNKFSALQHFCELNKIIFSEVAFVFDDVLDLSTADRCGLRIMIAHDASQLLAKYVEEKKLADYFTHSDGSNNAVREATELMMGLNGQFENTIANRMNNSQKYLNYLDQRNSVITKLFTAKDLSR